MRTPEEEQQLYDEYKHLIAITVGKKYTNRKFLRLHGLTLDDLLHYGSLGLWNACRTYDDSKGSQFKTYAINNIIWRINTESKNDSLGNVNNYTYDVHDNLSMDNTIAIVDGVKMDRHNFVESVEVGFDSVEDKEFINAVTKDLPIDLADIVKMRVDGMTLQEIGATIGKSHQSVRQRLLNNRGKISLAMNLYNQ